MLYGKIGQVNAKLAKLYKEDGPQLGDPFKSYSKISANATDSEELLKVYNPGLKKMGQHMPDRVGDMGLNTFSIRGDTRQIKSEK